MSEYVFDRSPLDEVIFAVDFATPELRSIAFGLYWKHISERFPIAEEERQPFTPAREDLGPDDIPFLRRVWFESVDHTRLIQLQAYRFMFNWRRKDSEYPEFHRVFRDFMREFTTFCAWAVDYSDGVPVNPIRLELSYINRLDPEHGWTLPLRNDRIFKASGPFPDGYDTPSVLSTYLLYRRSLGELYAIVRPYHAASDSSVSQFELRYMSDVADSQQTDWFEKAHDELSGAFLALTTEEAQLRWGRRKKAVDA